MKNEFINWVKSYEVEHNGKIYNLFIASHKAGYFNALISYIIEDTRRSDNFIQPRQIQTEYFNDFTEKSAYKKCENRLMEIIKEEFEIKEDKTNRFIKWE